MESTPLLEDERKQSDKSKVGNLLRVNVVFLLYHLAVNVYNPNIAQYLYKRFSDELFGNVTGDTQNATSKCLLNKSDHGYILQEEAQKKTSSFQVELIAVSSSTAVISCIFLGAYSDFVGRKFLFVVCLTGEMLRNVIITAIVYWDLDLKYMFIGEVCEGVSGGYNGVMLASYAYTADNTPPKHSRTIGLAFIDLTTNFALALSQAGTGYLINYFGFFYPSVATTGLMFLSLIMVIVMLPETIHNNGKKLPSPSEAIKNVFGFYFSKDFGVKRYLFWLALIAYSFAYFSQAGVYLIEYLFQLNLPFCWGPELIGYFNMAVSVAKQILGIPVIKLLHLCTSDEGLAIFTAIIQTGAYVLHGIAYNNVMLFAYMIPAAVAAPLFPALRALMSRMSPPDLQGSLFAGIIIVNITSSGLGISSFNEMYDATVELLRGFVFYVCAGVHVIVAIVAIAYLCISRRLDPNETNETVVINDQDWKPGPANSPPKVKEDSQV